MSGYIVDEVEGVGLCWNVPDYRLIDLSQWSVLGPRDCCTMGVMVHTVTLVKCKLHLHKSGLMSPHIFGKQPSSGRPGYPGHVNPIQVVARLTRLMYSA